LLTKFIAHHTKSVQNVSISILAVTVKRFR